jgi:cell wall-associated NlpC family hydrolase
MPLKRSTLALLLAAFTLPAFADAPWIASSACDADANQALYALSLDAELEALAPGFEQAAIAADSTASESAAMRAASFELASIEGDTVNGKTGIAESPRQLLVAVAMKLRDIRYRRGGRTPASGFDCSGFVQYVFAQALGIDLPDNSVSQYSIGAKVARDAMQTGDLVFFHTHGQRVSHVGIYLDHGRFIHSPTTGKHVQVDYLNAYWTKRFAGARRPNVLT